MMLIFTCYNAGEFTVATAYNFAVQGGSTQPNFEFINYEYLEPAIQTVVSRFKLGWNIEKKVEEISEYAHKVLAFMDLLHQQQTGLLHNSAANQIPLQNLPKSPIDTRNTNANPNNTNNNTNTTHSNTNVSTNDTNITHNNAPNPYLVVAGDTGTAIARKLNTTFDALQRANPSVTWSRLSIGQKLARPASTITQNPPNTTVNPPVNTNRNTAAPRTHVIKRGDNLSNLANMYKTSENALKAANPTKLKRWGDVEGFSVGDSIIIP